MKLLQMIKDIFGEMPDRPNIHEYFQKKREEYDNDRGFFNFTIQYLGGRSYNKFLDYALFAVKLDGIYRKYLYWQDGTWEEMKEGIEDLLFDDRHDLWQNLPYILDRVIDIANGNENPISVEDVQNFWRDVTTAMIECINIEGTGNQIVNMKYPLE